MQYFRVFRWDSVSSADSQMRLLATDTSQRQLWDSEEAVNKFLDGLEIAAEHAQAGL